MLASFITSFTILQSFLGIFEKLENFKANSLYKILTILTGCTENDKCH